MWGFSLCVFRINPCDYITTMSDDVRAIMRALVTHLNGNDIMTCDVRAIVRARITHLNVNDTMGYDVRAIARARLTKFISKV